MKTVAQLCLTAFALGVFLPAASLAQTSGGQTSGSSGSTSGGPAAGTSCTVSSQQVSLHIPDESAPPGGIVQMKFMVTEPTPITSGGPRLTKPRSTSVSGIHLFNPSGDVNGVAIDNGSQLSIAYVTANGTQGQDYPIMAIALQLSPSMPVGTQEQFALDPSSTWNLGLLGTATMKTMPPATITARGTISITNIVPGGGLLPAGTVVSILGIGFQSATQVQLSGFVASSIAIVSPQEIQIVLAAPTDMTGKKVQVVNPDGSQDTYFSYLRGIRSGQSNRSLLSSAIPIFSSLTHSQAVLTATSLANSSQFTGVAVQNQNLTPTAVTFTLDSSSNESLGTSTVVLASGAYLIYETSEVVQGVAPPQGSYLTVSGSQPVQVFGFQGDDAAGTVLPTSLLSSQP